MEAGPSRPSNLQADEKERQDETHSLGIVFCVATPVLAEDITIKNVLRAETDTMFRFTMQTYDIGVYAPDLERYESWTAPIARKLN